MHTLRAILGCIIVGVAPAQPVDRLELQALRAQVQQLEAQLKELSRQLEARERKTAAEPAPHAPAATAESGQAVVSDRGYTLNSAEAANSIRLRALLQADSRTFFDDDPALQNDGFLLRRARLITEGVLARNFSYLFTTEFGGSAVSILDAALTIRVADALHVKVGKYKTPIGLEVLQSDAATTFAERSMLAGLLPNRDLGVQLGGVLADRRIEYAAGVFNGVADGANSTNADVDEDLHFVGRLVFTPWHGRADSSLRGLLFGVGAGLGKQRTAAGRTAGYRTDGQQIYFSYLPDATAAGDVWRVSPQVDFRRGPLGLVGEYVISSLELRDSARGRATRLQHEGWQLTAAYVLTGEDSTYGQVAPQNDFDPAAGSWGAFEVVARYSEVDIDNRAFLGFAAPAASASDIAAYALGLKWYLSKAVVVGLNYYQSRFGLDRAAAFAVPAPLLRGDEKVFATRVQLAF